MERDEALGHPMELSKLPLPGESAALNDLMRRLMWTANQRSNAAFFLSQTIEVQAGKLDVHPRPLPPSQPHALIDDGSHSRMTIYRYWFT
eukprot:1145221-Pelagomonas_calceolata.AAC.4